MSDTAQTQPVAKTEAEAHIKLRPIPLMVGVVLIGLAFLAAMEPPVVNLTPLGAVVILVLGSTTLILEAIRATAESITDWIEERDPR